MNKVLPTIEMPAPPDSSANEPESVPDNVLPESGDGNMDLIDSLHAQAE